MKGSVALQKVLQFLGPLDGVHACVDVLRARCVDVLRARCVFDPALLTNKENLP